MFWRKKENGANEEKLPRPKEIAEPVGRHLIVNLKANPDWVWSLKSALRQKNDDKNIFDFRVFDAKEAANLNVIVRDYNVLASHPALILYEGTFNKKTFEVSLLDKGKKAA